MSIEAGGYFLETPGEPLVQRDLVRDVRPESARRPLETQEQNPERELEGVR